VLALALFTACGGGGGAVIRAERPRVTSPRRRSAPRAKPTSTTTSTALPRATAHLSDGVPPPAVVDRGADHVAIARSLAAYGNWLEWHDPDPALVERAYAPNSDLAVGEKHVVVEMQRQHKRIQELDAAPLDFEVVSVLPNVVSFRVTERLARRSLVDEKGLVLARVGPATEHYVVIMMRFRSDAPWRLLVVEDQSPPVEVHL
jgi:hypothetical protein